MARHRGIPTYDIARRVMANAPRELHDALSDLDTALAHGSFHGDVPCLIRLHSTPLPTPHTVQCSTCNTRNCDAQRPAPSFVGFVTSTKADPMLALFAKRLVPAFVVVATLSLSGVTASSPVRANSTAAQAEHSDAVLAARDYLQATSFRSKFEANFPHNPKQMRLKIALDRVPVLENEIAKITLRASRRGTARGQQVRSHRRRRPIFRLQYRDEYQSLYDS